MPLNRIILLSLRDDRSFLEKIFDEIFRINPESLPVFLFSTSIIILIPMIVFFAVNNLIKGKKVNCEKEKSAELSDDQEKFDKVH
jgi:hypothetical protein